VTARDRLALALAPELLAALHEPLHRDDLDRAAAGEEKCQPLHPAAAEE